MFVESKSFSTTQKETQFSLTLIYELILITFSMNAHNN